MRWPPAIYYVKYNKWYKNTAHSSLYIIYAYNMDSLTHWGFLCGGWDCTENRVAEFQHIYNNNRGA
jgi:hypothetical protein